MMTKISRRGLEQGVRALTDVFAEAKEILGQGI